MMIFWCSTCNQSTGPTNPNSAGQGTISRPFKPVRIEMWLHHLISPEHQQKTRQMNKRHNRGPYKGSIHDYCSFIVVSASRLRLFPLAVWCLEFGMLTDLVTYPQLGCIVVSIQGASDSGAAKAQSIQKETMFQQQLIRVFSAASMTDAEWIMVREGDIRNELYQQENLRLTGRNGQPNESSQTKRVMKTAAQTHHPTARNDKENRGDKVDGPSRDQTGGVGKYGDSKVFIPLAVDRSKTNSPRVQVKENVVEAVSKMEEQLVEPTVIVIKERELVNEPKGMTGNEQVSSVGGGPMRERSGKYKRRQRYAIVNIRNDMKPPSALLSTTVVNDAALTTATEENKLSDLVEQVEIVDLSVEPIDLVVRVVEEKIEVEVVKANAEENEIEVEVAKAGAEEGKVEVSIGEQKADAEEEKVIVEVVEADAEENEIEVEVAKAGSEVGKVEVLIGEQKADAEEEKVEVEVVEHADTKEEEIEVEPSSVEDETADAEESKVHHEEKKDEVEKTDVEHDKVEVEVEKEDAEEGKVEVEERKADAEEKVEVEEDKTNADENKVEVQEEKADVEEEKEKKVEAAEEEPDVEDKVEIDSTSVEEEKVDDKENKVQQKKVQAEVTIAGEKTFHDHSDEKNEDVEEEDYMAYAMYWYRF